MTSTRNLRLNSYNQLSLNFTETLLMVHELRRANFISQHGLPAYLDRESTLKSIIAFKKSRMPNVNTDNQWADFHDTINDHDFNRRMLKKYGLPFEQMMSEAASLKSKNNPSKQ